MSARNSRSRFGERPGGIDRRAGSSPTFASKLSPQLATLSATVLPNAPWVVETKFDGYRLMARLEGKRVQLFTRNGHDWTAKLKNVATAVAALQLGPAWIDGEIELPAEFRLPTVNG